MSILLSSPLSCSHLDRTLSLETCDEHARSAVLAHAGECPVCGPALEELSSVSRTLRAVAPLPLVTAERARIWRGVASRRRAPSAGSWLVFAGASVAVAAAAILMLALRGAPGLEDALPVATVTGELTPIESPAEMASAAGVASPRAMPVSRWLRAPRAVSADLGLAKVSLEAGAVVALEPRAPREIDLRLFRGKASLAVEKLAPSEAFEVTTPLARVKVVGTRFRVESRADVTRVEVQEGTVWVWENGSESAKVVRAGQALEVKAPATPREVLSEARALLDSDASGAARMAGTLVDQGAAPEVEVEAILLVADAERRRGDPGRAAALYRRAADHAHGAPYAEEALYKCATLLGASGDVGGALAVLADAERRVGMGAIGPERASLEAELHLTAGDQALASAALERAASRARTVGDEASARVFTERRARILRR